MFANLLIHELRVYRRSGNPDRFGQPAQDHSEWTRYRCRSTNAQGGEQNDERSHDVVLTNHTVFVERGADVRESDLVSVFDRDGQEVVPAGQVLLKRPVYDGVGSHHIELVIRCQRNAR